MFGNSVNTWVASPGGQFERIYSRHRYLGFQVPESINGYMGNKMGSPPGLYRANSSHNQLPDCDLGMAS